MASAASAGWLLVSSVSSSWLSEDASFRAERGSGLRRRLQRHGAVTTAQASQPKPKPKPQPQPEPQPQAVVTRRSLIQRSSGLLLFMPAAAPVLTTFVTRNGSNAARAVDAPSPRSGVPKSPEANATLYAALQSAIRETTSKGKAPGVLRLAFHDAGTYDPFAGAVLQGGPNGSIRFEDKRPENEGLQRPLRVIAKTMASLKKQLPNATVSWADVIAVAGAESVAITGGPTFRVPIGRVDAQASDADGRMPGENWTAAQLKSHFAAQGFSTRELVALLGAHTIGFKGYGMPDVFDNTYYKTLLEKPWKNSKDAMAYMIGIPIDHAVAEDTECLQWIQLYAADQQQFFNDFAAAYTKMTSAGAVWSV
eukprot:jgi/Chlat1/8603/Chrsp86S07999